MKEYRSYVRANPVTPANQFLRQIVFYPNSYANQAAMLADLPSIRVILYLIGSGEKGTIGGNEDTNLDKIYANDLPKWAHVAGNNKEGIIIICPQIDGTSTQFMTTNISRVYEMLITEFPNAKDYNVTGLSMGGQGTYGFVATYTTFFKTAGILAGNDYQAFLTFGNRPTSPIPNTATTHIRHWHGTLDTSSDYASGEYSITKLTTQGYPNEHTFVPLAGYAHNIWPKVYVDDNLYFAWFDTYTEATYGPITNGMSYHLDEVAIWADRLQNGPYLNDIYGWTGNAPGEEVILKANMLLNDQVDDYWNGNYLTDDAYTYAKGHYVLAAAFYYLCTESLAHGLKAKEAVLLQVANPNPDFESYRTTPPTPPPSGNLFHYHNFANRLILAYDYTKNLWSESERNTFIAWLDRIYPMVVRRTQKLPLYNFPNRNNRDYSVKMQWALVPTEIGPTVENSYTHLNAQGGFVNKMLMVHTCWPNATAVESVFCIMYGILKNDNSIIDNAKIYQEEFISYGTYSDGRLAEAYRNYSSDVSLGTMWYGPINYEAFIFIADLLRRRGDTSLYEWTPNPDLQGNTGSRNLRSIIGAKIRECSGSERTYFNSVQVANVHDTLRGASYRYKCEVPFALANRYYKDTEIEDCYKLIGAERQYGPGYSGGPYYEANSVWAGCMGIFPAAPLMWYDTEDLTIYVEGKAINKRML